MKIYLLGVILLLACTDYVTTAKEFKQQQNLKTDSSNTADSIQIDSLKAVSNGLVRTLFSSTLIGSWLDSIEIKVSGIDSTLSPHMKFWNLFGSDSTLLLEQELRWEDSLWCGGNRYTGQNLSADTEDYIQLIAIYYGDEIALKLERPEGLNKLLNQWSYQAEAFLADNKKSGLQSLKTNLENALQHAKLAIRGSHTTHLKHVSHFLSGRKGLNLIWWDDARVSGVDTLGAIEQLNEFNLFISKQQNSIHPSHSEILQSWVEALNSQKNSLAIDFDLLEEWINLPHSEAIPLIESLVTKITKLLETPFSEENIAATGINEAYFVLNHTHLFPMKL